MTVDPTSADALHLEKTLEGSRRTSRDFQGLTIGHKDERRNALFPRRLTTPSDQTIVADPLGLVELGQKPQECSLFRFLVCVAGSRRRTRGFGVGAVELRTLERTGLEEHRPAGPPVMLEELRTGTEHFPVLEIGVKPFVVEEPGPDIERNCNYFQLTHNQLQYLCNRVS